MEYTHYKGDKLELVKAPKNSCHKEDGTRCHFWKKPTSCPDSMLNLCQKLDIIFLLARPTESSVAVLACRDYGHVIQKSDDIDSSFTLTGCCNECGCVYATIKIEEQS